MATEPRRFEGRVAFVTGGASGIGQVVAERLALEGAAILLADQNIDKAQVVADGIQANGGSVETASCDVSDAEQVDAAFAKAHEKFGPLDILVNSAAIPQVRPFLKMTLAEWQKVIDVNMTGSFLCAQAAAKAMVAADKAGRIIQISSINAQRAITGRGAYSVAKGGLAIMVKVMAAELGQAGITVNAVAPGPVDTPMVLEMHTQETRAAFNAHLPIKRYAQPAEVAAATAFLASDEAAYITGHTINVDGGFDAAGMLFDLGPLG
ncbi:MAG: SDR family oxidoreductase [Pseudomonadota bacterium]